jgi:hypoxanthine-guanine phosphoribosyltransferase
MKYKFNLEDDIVSLKYKDKEFTFKTNVKLVSEMQSLVMKARIEMIQDINKSGQTIKDFTKEIKKDGKTYYDNTNKVELEKIYQEKITLEFFNKKCEEIFGMDIAGLMQDIGLTTEEEGSKFSNDLISYLSGNIPR